MECSWFEYFPWKGQNEGSHPTFRLWDRVCRVENIKVGANVLSSVRAEKSILGSSSSDITLNIDFWSDPILTHKFWYTRSLFSARLAR